MKTEPILPTTVFGGRVYVLFPACLLLVACGPGSRVDLEEILRGETESETCSNYGNSCSSVWVQIF